MTSPSIDANLNPGESGYYAWHEAVARHHNDSSSGAPHHSASRVSVTPSGLAVVSSSDVQGALADIDSGMVAQPSGASVGDLLRVSGTDPVTVEAIDSGIFAAADDVRVAVVRHGIDADVTRPDRDHVVWIGSVRPRNRQSGDEWRDTAIRLQAAGDEGTSLDPPTGTVYDDGAGGVPRWIIDGHNYDQEQPPDHIWTRGDAPALHTVWLLLPDPDSLQRLYLHSTSVSGDVAAMSLPGSLQRLYLNHTSVSGDVAAMSLPGSLQWLYLHSTSVSGDVAAMSLPDSLQGLLLHSTSVSGDVSAVAWPPLTDGPLLTNTDVTGPLSVTGLLDSTRIRVSDCGWSQAEVDGTVQNIYDQRDNWNAANPELQIGGTNAAPGSAAQTQINELVDTYGWTIGHA